MGINTSGLQPSSLGHQEWGTLPDAEEFPTISGVPGPSTQGSAAEIQSVPPTNGIINDESMHNWTTNIPSQSSSSAHYPIQLDDLFPASGDDDLFGEPPPATFVDSAEQLDRTSQSTTLGNGTLQTIAYDVNNPSSINPVPGEAPDTPAPVTNQLPNHIQQQIMVAEVESMRLMLRAEEEERQQRTVLLRAVLRAQEQARAQRTQLIRAWGAAIEKRPPMD